MIVVVVVSTSAAGDIKQAIALQKMTLNISLDGQFCCFFAFILVEKT